MANADVQRYLREIKEDIPCAGKRKRDILRKIDETIGSYLEENPDARYGDMTARLGTPKQIVTSCLEEMDTGELIKRLKIKRKIVGIVAAAAIAVVALWAITVSVIYIENRKDGDGYFVEYISNVTYGEQSNGGN